MIERLKDRVRALLAAADARLVEDWREALKWWSVRWALVGTIVLPSLQVLPSELPGSLQGLFPPALRAGIAGLWCAGFFAFRVWGQSRSND